MRLVRYLLLDSSACRSAEVSLEGPLLAEDVAHKLSHAVLLLLSAPAYCMVGHAVLCLRFGSKGGPLPKQHSTMWGCRGVEDPETQAQEVAHCRSNLQRPSSWPELET